MCYAILVITRLLACFLKRGGWDGEGGGGDLRPSAAKFENTTNQLKLLSSKKKMHYRLTVAGDACSRS